MATRVAPLAGIRRLGAAVRTAWRTASAWPHAVANAWRRPWADIGIVPGSSRTRIVVPGARLPTEAPSYVAVDPAEPRILAWGDEARRMEGRAPAPVTVIRPFRQGGVGHFEAAVQLLAQLIKRAPCGIHLGGLRAIVALPSHATPLERLGMREAVLASGVRVVHLVDEGVAAALGAGLTLDRAEAYLLVSVGAETTQITCVGYGGLMVDRSLRVGSEAMDRAISAHLKRSHHLTIGDQAAETLKQQLGILAPAATSSLEVGGRDLRSGVPRLARVTADDVRVAVEPVLLQITDAIRQALASLPNAALDDVMRRGIGLSGGGAALPGLDRFVAERVGVGTVCLAAPSTRVARGVQRMLEDKRLLRASLLADAPAETLQAEPPRRTVRARPLRLAAPAAAFAVLAVLALLRPTLLHDAADTASAMSVEGAVRPPLQRSAEAVRALETWSRGVWEGVQGRRALEARVPLLEASLAKARSESRWIDGQNAELSRLLHLQPARRARALSANVTLRDPTGWLESLVIDRGTEGGARPGMAVMVGDGLLGQVVWAGPSSSRVRLLTSPGAVVACRIEGRRAAGVLYGVGDDVCELRYLDPDTPVRAGDRVLTSGLDGVHPPGLPVGRVERLQPSRDALFRTALVRPAAPVDSTATVLLLSRTD